MASRRAWVLNLDADLELGAERSHELSLQAKAAMKPHAEHLASSLLAEGDICVDETTRRGSAIGLLGRAFCPTPCAVATLLFAGAEPEPHPPVEVLRRVNSRAFSSSLGATMPDAAFVDSEEHAFAMLDRAPRSVGAEWRVKHAFGMSGRNQRVIVPSKVDERDRGFIVTGLRRGGVQIEPNVVIEHEYAIHGVLAKEGSLELGRLVRQRCNARGAWLGTEPCETNGPLSATAKALAEEARRVAGALHDAGYFGPFGIDAFTYRDRAGALALQPRSEINARYSMGFAVGMRLSRGVGSR
jgi:hypothetical protein